MRTTIKQAGFRTHLLTAAVAIGMSTQAYAVNFTIGEIEGQFDTSLSMGASWALRGADPDFISPFNAQGVRGNSSSRLSDDNRLNFKKGETFSKIFKGIHDLELKYGDSGIFVRGKYWYDFELKDEHRLFYDIDDRGRQDMAKASAAEFLDAFVYHNYTLGELPGNVRVGKQVVSWGESTFIGNSINSINPIDVAALRRPGAEVKEGLIPVNMFYLSQNITENVSAEAFYQLEWESTVVDNCGTFFGADPLAKGCYDRQVGAGPDLAPGLSENTANPPGFNNNTDNAYTPRVKDNEARDGGQYGLALRWFVPELHDTEFGAYVMNYHSRSPYLSTLRSTVAFNAANPIPALRASRYFVDYPEDIRLYGLSFQTNVGGTSLGGEISYRPNMPLQLNNTDLAGATTGNPSALLNRIGYATTALGGEINGYKRMPVLQTQVSATQFFEQVMGASRLTLVGEVGYNRINGLGEADGSDVRFGRSGIFGVGVQPGRANAACLNTVNNPQQECNDKGFYTTDSWGYRARARLDYPNVIAGINLAPNLAWSHDVDGNGPNFEEGLKAISLGVDADYTNTYTASLSYTDFFGGDFNTNGDRDFVALSFGVNF
ncbi:DUF1302 domain-containing protein [Pseudomonas tussilaginis]|uniref:DUF1302 domain-containing protein n=1 Tax=unclassified Pseudomonas TaxID=196821 RepID=UPI000C6EC710|nr:MULTISPECIES: DUF1302 domain-containing protein [unclassified Pseudomonas]QYX48718.1 DUF1302 domain-containing protein [Pseudomonas sp. S11A 273]